MSTPSERQNAAHLLIVDDQTLQLQTLCNILRDHGFVVTGCTGAAQAMPLLRAGPCDMLVTDLMMPEVDGIGLLREALRIDPMLAAVVVTGEGSIASAVEAMRSGACDYLLKPFKLGTILPVIERGLAMRRLKLENRALEQAVLAHAAELEASNRELDAFTRSASHDLRSPLQGVLGFAGLLQRSAGQRLTDQERGWLAGIDASGRRMNSLIDDLMRLSRLGRHALQRQPVDLGLLVRSAIDELTRQHQGPAGDFSVTCGALPRVEADEPLLRQVFLNLLSNAFKYTRTNPGARIEVGCEDRAGERVYFVADNGPGFDMAQAEKLFEPFQRLPSAPAVEGSGVGLSIVQRIVQRHGGRVWADAAPGRGATFYFTLGTEANELAPAHGRAADAMRT